MISKKIIVLKQDIFYKHKDSMAILRPSKKSTVSALIQFPDPIGEQYYKVDLKDYEKDISWARTFFRSSMDKEKWARCRKVLPSLPKNVKNSWILAFNKNGWIVPPVVRTEPARHKILDFIGDFSILETSFQADITLIRPGHEFNRRLVMYLQGLGI